MNKKQAKFDAINIIYSLVWQECQNPTHILDGLNEGKEYTDVDRSKVYEQLAQELEKIGKRLKQLQSDK